MADLNVLSQALAANLIAAIEGVQWSAYTLANPSLPAGYVFPGTPNELPAVVYDQAFGRGMDTWTFTVIVLVTHTLDIGAQKLLYEFMASSGAGSVKEAIEADSTLGGECDDLRVVNYSGVKEYRHSAGVALGAEWRIEVIAEG